MTAYLGLWSRHYIYSFISGKWTNEKVKTPDLGSIGVVGTDDLADKYFFAFTNFITPTTLYAADANNNTFKGYKSYLHFLTPVNMELANTKPNQQMARWFHILW